MDKLKRVNLVLTLSDAEDLVAEIGSLRDLVEVDDLEPEWPMLAKAEERVARLLTIVGRSRRITTPQEPTPE